MNDIERNLAWKLNWWRQSELEGPLLLGKMVSIANSAELCHRLTRHCAEEAEHSRLWAATLMELGLPHICIRRSYQSFYIRHTGLPGTLLEVLAFTQVFERRVHRRFLEEVRDRRTPSSAMRAYKTMMEDEKNHLAWVASWLVEQRARPRNWQGSKPLTGSSSPSFTPRKIGFGRFPVLGSRSLRRRYYERSACKLHPSHR